MRIKIPINEIIGTRYGRLTAVSEAETACYGSGKKRMINCMCDCGNEKVVLLGSLRKGKTRSCGCLHSEELAERNATHGMSKLKECSVWRSMVARCHNKNHKYYHCYGGRGIEVCPEWRESFEKFYEDIGDIPEGLSIDRIDNNDGYHKENIKLATRKEQARNRRTNRIVEFRGEYKILKDWAEDLGFNHDTLKARLDKGWSQERAFTTPLRKYRRYRSISYGDDR